MFDSAPANLPIEPTPKTPDTPGGVLQAPSSPLADAVINVTGTKEPEDIFAGIKEPMVQPQAAASAVLPSSAPARSGVKTALVIIIPLVVLGLGIGGWFAYQRFFAPKPTLNLPKIKDQQTVLPVTSAPNEAPQTPNPFPEPDEDQLAAAQATISMMQGQAMQAKEMAEALEQATTTAPPPFLPEIGQDGELLATTGQDVAGTETTDTAIQLPATNSAIPLPEQIAPKVLIMGMDSDSDGLTNAEELALGTDIMNKDTDGDGFEDGAELNNGYDPLAKNKKIGDSSGIKSETVGETAILIPNSWERSAGVGGTVNIKTGSPSTFSISLLTYAAGGSLLDWVMAQNPGVASSDYTTEKNANGFDVVYSKDGMTAWLLQGNTVAVFRYATNGETKKDFGALFKLMVNQASVVK